MDCNIFQHEGDIISVRVGGYGHDARGVYFVLSVNGDGGHRGDFTLHLECIDALRNLIDDLSCAMGDEEARRVSSQDTSLFGEPDHASGGS